MSLEAFSRSEPLTLGVELELQLVSTHDYDLAPYAEDMLRLMHKTPLPGSVVPEMTNSMIEISTDVCHSCSEVLSQLTPIRDALVKSADKLNIAVVDALESHNAMADQALRHEKIFKGLARLLVGEVYRQLRE